ncbi:hypothetical protein [Mucilaginibacter flavidus]|uniref:hypothetical protein n=1 Tax=Mucilaginibacter flavidus TaxID=2949309 RepID=UPI0020923AEF|nr:hypothetical protein [Mucilaginibacter flavidus]MCO5948081.1 hypothetical protein [Mucilaginibacter flavidus]
METIEDNTQLIPNELFTAAFIKHFKCKRKEFEIEMLLDNESAFVIYQQQGYKIETFDCLKKGVEYMLTDKDRAQHIDLSIWNEVSAPMLKKSKFYMEVIDALDNQEQANLFRLAVTFGSYTENVEEIFWYALQELDRTGEVFGNAIVAAAKSQNFERLADDLTNHQIMYGDTVYNDFVGGIFEIVYLENSDHTFYIYSADHYKLNQALK